MPRIAESGDRLVLVIEADGALRRIMALGLRQRNLRVLESPSLGAIWDQLDEPPALVVLDIGVGATSEWMLPPLLRRHRLLRAAPVVLLAWECPLAEVAALAAAQAPTRLCLAKPFDARALYAAVDELLAAPGAAALPAAHSPVSASPVPGSASARVAQGAAPLDHPTASGAASALAPVPAPSLWPLLAAGAATLAVAGFFIRPIYALVGLFLLIVVALWWSTALVRPSSHA
ncbi:MAG TPA: hypothetical protein VIG30_00150 [Ktedonobacterales bacterium]|jgi:CheY-like chemotaxis protein